MGDLVSAAIGAGSGLLSTIWNQYAPLSRSAKEAFSLQQQETMRQEQRQEDFFNKYQSIPAQVSQMQQVGINPALAAGGISAGSVPSSPSASSPQIDKADMSAILGQTLRLITEMKDAKLSRDLAISKDEREERLAQAEIRLKNANAWKQEFENFHAEDLWSLDRETRVQALEMMKRNVSHLDNQLVLDTIGISKAEAEASISIFQAAMAQFDAEHQEEIYNLQKKYSELQYQISERMGNAQVAKLYHEIENIDSDTAKKKIESSKISAEEKRLLLDYKLAEKTFDAAVDKAYADLDETKSRTVKNVIETSQESHKIGPVSYSITRSDKYLTKAFKNVSKLSEYGRQ